MRPIALFGITALVLLAIVWRGTDVHPRADHPAMPHVEHTATRVDALTELSPIELAGRTEALDPEVVIDPVSYPPEEVEPAQVLVAKPATEGIPVHGRLLLPEAWGGGLHKVHFRGPDDDEFVTDAAHERDADGCSVHPFALRVAEPGRYAVWIEDPPFAIELDVFAPVDDFEMRAPPLLRVSICIVDAVSSSPIDGARVYCTPAVRPPHTRWRFEVQPIDDRTGVFEARCVAGDVVVSCSARAGGYEPKQVTVRVQDVDTEVVVRMLTATRLAVHLVDSDTQLPVNLNGRTSVHYVLESADGLSGGGGQLSIDSHGNGELRLKREVRHILRISEPPAGYQPSHPLAVEPRLGEVTDVVFRLKPNR